MHLYIATKGIKKEVDDFITQLQGKYLPIKWRDSKDKPFEDAFVQLSVRPIQLWEIGFPKESYDVVANTVFGIPYDKFVKEAYGAMGNDGKKPTTHKWTRKFAYMFRKALHLDPLPRWDITKGNMPIGGKSAVLIIGLGTKQDYIMDTGVEGL